MKKTITGLMLFFSLLILAQDIKPNGAKLLLEGIWEANETSYICIITVNEGFNTVKTIHNVSFEEDLVLIEKVLSQDDKQVITTLHNKLNNHKVFSTYSLINEDQLLRNIRGDANADIVYTRRDNKLRYQQVTINN
tara:strand:+ start:319 stop:726 length:408 start_codon:yes stop_codon:yes gene_type:complete